MTTPGAAPGPPAPATCGWHTPLQHAPPQGRLPPTSRELYPHKCTIWKLRLSSSKGKLICFSVKLAISRALQIRNCKCKTSYFVWISLRFYFKRSVYNFRNFSLLYLAHVKITLEMSKVFFTLMLQSSTKQSTSFLEAFVISSQESSLYFYALLTTISQLAEQALGTLILLN